MVSILTEEKDNAIIYGYAIYILYNDIVWGEGIYVDNGYTNKGYGTYLVHAIINYVNGIFNINVIIYKNLHAKTLLGNDNVKHFYLDKLGFRVLSYFDSYDDKIGREKFALIELAL